MSFRAVVFDLDGTLLDTLADISDAANRVLQRHGCRQYPYETYREFVGYGVSVLFQQALPEDLRTEEMIARCAEGFRKEYAKSWSNRTRIYDGVEEMLDALVEREICLAILSNKPHEFTVECTEHFFSSRPFEVVLGQRAEIPPKPDPAGAREITARLGLPAAEFVYLGDSQVDIETARNAGMHAVGASWGFRSREQLLEAGAAAVIDHPRKFPAIVLGRA